MREIWWKMYIGPNVNYPLLLQDFNEIWIFSTDFRKLSNIKFHENPFTGKRVVLCGRMDRQTWRSWKSLFEILQKHLKKEVEQRVWTAGVWLGGRRISERHQLNWTFFLQGTQIPHLIPLSSFPVGEIVLGLLVSKFLTIKNTNVYCPYISPLDLFLDKWQPVHPLSHTPIFTLTFMHRASST